MNIKRFGCWAMVVVGAIVWAALGVLLVLQWGNHAAFSRYGQNITVNTAVLMICSGVGALLLCLATWSLAKGIAGIRRAGRAAAAQPPPATPAPNNPEKP